MMDPILTLCATWTGGLPKGNRSHPAMGRMFSGPVDV
jgi:hypothetical protein